MCSACVRHPFGAAKRALIHPCFERFQRFVPQFARKSHVLKEAFLWARPIAVAEGPDRADGPSSFTFRYPEDLYRRILFLGMFCQAPDSRGVLGAGRFPRVALALPPSFRRSVTGLAGRSSPVGEGFRTEGEMVLVRSPCGQRVRKHRAARRKISDVVFVVLSSTELRLARIIALLE